MQEHIIDFLNKNIPGLKGVYLFGSRANGQVRPGSDWDIAFLVDGKPLPGLQKWELQEQLAGLINTDVDLIDLQDASTVMRFQVVTTGTRIFCSDAYFCENFEIRCYSSYQYFQEERKEIIEDILKRGSVYG